MTILNTKAENVNFIEKSNLHKSYQSQIDIEIHKAANHKEELEVFVKNMRNEKEEQEITEQQKKERINYRIPQFQRDHSLATILAKQMHLKQQDKSTRLPMIQSITPSPFETHVPIEKMNKISTKRSPASFSLSSRFNPYQDFARSEWRPVAPNTYNIGRDITNGLSTSKQTADIKMHQRLPIPQSFGPGPGKYNTRESFNNNEKISAPKYSLKGRSDKFMSFVNQGSKMDTPAPGDYDVLGDRRQRSQSSMAEQISKSWTKSSINE